MFWSPDSQKIAFIDHTQTIQIFDMETKEKTIVDRGLRKLHGALQQFELSWSPDSRWIAYSRGLETLNSAVFLFSLESGETNQVTSGFYSDSGPVFDPDGKLLYYRSNRSLSPIYSDLDATWIYPNTTRIVAVTLQEATPSPLGPRNDDEKPQSGESDGAQKEQATGEEKPGEPSESAEGEKGGVGKPLQIDLEDFESRGVVLPMEAGNYGALRAVTGKLVFHRLPRSGSTQTAGGLFFYDLKERKESEIVSGINQFEASADGKKLLVRSLDRWAVLNVSPNQKIEKPLRLDELETTVDPRREWAQIFQDVWRAYRDFFYDPNLHGLNWKTVGEQYRRLLEDAVTRWDVNFVIGELIGEVNASHTYVAGGDLETPESKRVGLLGVDWEIGDGAYRIGRIVPTPPWELEARSPLRAPGVDVREGDYVLAVNGIPLDPTKDPYAPFQGLAEKTVSLTVNSAPGLEGARQVLVETLGSEARIRNLDWIESNRRRVEELSEGRIGYLYVPNTGISGQTELIRQFSSQARKEGLIIDERFNAGGQLPDRFIEQMQRQLVTLIYFRHGEVALHPALTHYGPKAMLINGWAGSGGDAFPLFFKELGAGPLVGERTWGGLIGPAVGHSTIDGGFFTAPPGRIYTPSGEWFAEGRGVEPDIPVVDDPTLMARGGDPQLERAVQEVLRLLELDPPRIPTPPPFEKRVPARR
ncbi:MAG TPA: PDZ domain-containing protein [Acidobacteriota bacterium]|nr:PDZ domain-containing protein [Acidobacteriota bacterium]